MAEKTTKHSSSSGDRAGNDTRADPLPIPALNFVGYSLDLCTITPLDVGSVSESVKRAVQVIDVNPYDRPYEIEIDGVLYRVPRMININFQSKSEQAFESWTTGGEVTRAFLNNNALTSQFGAIAGSSSSGYAFQKSFLDRHQFGFFSQNTSAYSANLKGYLHALNEEELERPIKRLPNPFKEDTETLRAYRNFFATFGSHAIVDAQYGSRFQLVVHASNSDPAVNDRFNANIRANFGGIMSNGVYDPAVKAEAQYKRYENFMMRTLSIRGGDKELALDIQATPDSYPLFVKWLDTGRTNPDIMSFGCMELWNLVREAEDREIADYADPLYDAFKYITSHPEVYRTAVNLTIESDWGEFGVLTPSAICQQNPDKPIEDPNNLVFRETRVRWGKEHSHAYKRVTVEFWVLNDGSPIDFTISHGSNGSQPGSGTATVSFGGHSYVNKGIIDNNWNTMYFFQKNVSGSPVFRHTPMKHAPPTTWNQMLNEYLKRHRRGDIPNVEECKCVEAVFEPEPEV